jgi:general secretion pathway protein D
LKEENRQVIDLIENDRTKTFEMQQKMAELVEQFNDLLDEERFAEAEVIARQFRELDPDSEITRLVTTKSKFLRRLERNQSIADAKEDGFVTNMLDVDDASRVNVSDAHPIDFGDTKRWDELKKSRLELLEMQERRLSPVEIEIQNTLKKPVDVNFNNRPLKEVLDTLASLSGVNIYADPQGLAAEGVTSDTPVNITLTKEVSLESALNLILEPLRLSYVIQNEVLRITSEQLRDSNVHPRVYNVADLVIPIPNFIPGYNIGLPSAIREAHNSLGYGGAIQPVSMAPLTLSTNDLQGGGPTSASSLAQINSYGGLPQGSHSRPSQSPGYGPGSMGGAALADFDTLIQLITSTIKPDTWDEVGGPGAIEEFPTNLSLVISQTQDVHEQIADLLEQLRRLQDLQVTIEVRFITLNDNFFERIGVDFDFDVDDNVTALPSDDSGPSVAIGLGPDGNPTPDFDFSFTQDSFGVTVPAFGGYSGANAANFGFAILSDIEAFFLVQAATGSDRNNVLSAPKVTLFNGQLASVSDVSQRPFVTSLIPVVGDFAAAHQPVIVVLSEGTSLGVQAVVSSDRRFVRLTLVPMFSQIGEVEEFTFDGKTTTNTGSNVVDAAGEPTGSKDNTITTTEGTTVQLPTFSFTTVSTTVSVPDGGTVLLGGIKRLSESRVEQGVPMLNKLPYVNRLFKNVGIGRDTQSLMLMVTPRIIIQEEEEEKLGIERTP